SDNAARKTARNSAANKAVVLTPSAASSLLWDSTPALLGPGVSALLPSKTAASPDKPPSAPSKRGHSNSSSGPSSVIALRTTQLSVATSIQAPNRAHHSRSSSSIHFFFDTMPINNVMPARMASTTPGTPSIA